MFGSLLSTVFSGFGLLAPVKKAVPILEVVPDPNEAIVEAQINSVERMDAPQSSPEVASPDDDADELLDRRMEVLTSDQSKYESDLYDASNSSKFLFWYGGNRNKDYSTGSDFNDDFRGGDSNDSYFGQGGNDIIYGGRGSDKLNGGTGNDHIYGGSGQDLLEGGTGDDVLVGGADIDVFVFRKGSGTTRIEDFVLGFDVLDMEDFGYQASEAYEALIDRGTQYGADIYFQLGQDLLVLANADLATMVADDLCIR